MPPNPNTRFRERRELRRKQKRRRRVALGVVLLAFVGGLAYGASAGNNKHQSTDAKSAAPAKHAKRHGPPLHRPRPADVRGVHVTMALAGLPGKIAGYARIPNLNTIELDVKDENGNVGFVPSSVPLAKSVGAARPFYRPQPVVSYLHRRGIYVIGRVVTFEDPILSEARPSMAVRTADGGVWHNNGGLGWTNPYDKRVWRYDVDIATAAAKAGFDEIQFDYVRFPSDGDLSLIRYPGVHPQPMGWTIPTFIHYAAKRLHPLGARVSVDVFGLSATRDLGIGQYPRRIAQYADAVYPMVYPSHYNSGEYGISDPDNDPADTVARALSDFQFALHGRKARLIPWLQDFTIGRTYTLDDIRAQVSSARQFSTSGFLLWNPEGVYTRGGLAP